MIYLIRTCVKTHTGKCFLLAWALNFWRILNISDSDRAKKGRKKIGLISLVMNVTIPETYGRTDTVK